MLFGKYNKFVAALIAGLVAALPALQAAQPDGVSLQEWLTIAGLFLPALAVALAPANALPTKELVDQALKDPSIDLKIEARPTGLSSPPRMVAPGDALRDK